MNYHHKSILITILFFLTTCNLVFSQRFESAEEVIEFCEMIDLERRYIGELNTDSLPSLPIGLYKEIAGVKYTIAIDSARFQTNGAFFDAYMALEIPGLENKIAFRATNIQFNPKGVIGGSQSKLTLVSDQRVNFGPKIALLFPGDGSNYVEWDCNGFKAVNLKGIFEFDSDLVEPIDGLEKVEASFEVFTSDVRNILISASVTPFQIKGKDDFQFFVTDAVIDLSDDYNPENVVLPSQYQTIYEESINNWRGFFLRSLEVKLPQPLSNGEDRITIGVENMVIDNSGLSGDFLVDNLISISEGDLSGWPFSVSRLEVGFICNRITSGGIAGEFKLPAVDQTNLEYSAEIKEGYNGSTEYNFSLSPSDPLFIRSISTEFYLDPSTRLEVNISDGKFKPILTVTGQLSILMNKTQIVGMSFQDIRFVTEAPYITDGIFELTTPGDSSKMERFNIQLERFYIQFSETAPVLGAEVRLNIGKDSDGGNESGFALSVATGFKIYTEVVTIPPTQFEVHPRQVWEFDRFEVTDIALDISTNALHLQGVLSFRRNDQVYGDGFFGAISLKIDKILEGGIPVTFFGGKVEGYRYWFVDITVPAKIHVGSGISINKIRGGIAYHVEDTRTKEQLIASANQGSFVPPNAYVPNREVGLMLKAGVGLDWASESVLNADVLFSITFNSHGGFNEVYFLGKVYCLVARQGRGSGGNSVEGAILVHYDNVEKVFDAQVEASINFAEVVEGNVSLRFHVSPDVWFIKVNTPQNPANVTLINFAGISTYLMIGKQLEPSLPPPSTVMDLIGISNSENRDEEAMILGNGFAHGSRMRVGGEVSFGWEGFAIYGSLDIGAGYDLTIYNFGPNVRCEGRSGPIGMKGWYLEGQVYAYIGFAVGIRGKIFGAHYDLPLIEAYLAMYLAGKLPKPTYAEGGVGVRAKLIGIFKVKFNLNFSVGDRCNLIQT